MEMCMDEVKAQVASGQEVDVAAQIVARIDAILDQERVREVDGVARRAEARFRLD
jgi:hypothetical protein